MGRVAVAIVVGLAVPVVARAQWTVVNLHPTGSQYSIALGVRDGQQVGETLANAGSRASLWSSSSNSWVDLSPRGSTYAVARAPHASPWMGTASSRVDLHQYLPFPSGQSQANDAWSDDLHTYVDGYAVNALTERYEALMWVASPPSQLPSYTAVPLQTVNNLYGARANCISGDGSTIGGREYDNVYYNLQSPLLWRGISTSPIDMTPLNCVGGQVWGISFDGLSQVGVFYRSLSGSDNGHAVLWSSNPNLSTDIHPVGLTANYDYSGALSVSPGGSRQAGYAGQVSGPVHAIIWSGSGLSFLDIHPAQYAGSYAYGVSDLGSRVVGAATAASGWSHAMLWSGAAYVSTDLHPAGYASSLGRGISRDGMLQVGTATIATTSSAIIWRGDALTYTVLNPPNIGAEAIAISPNGRWQVGWQGNGAALWEGSPSSYVPLQSFLPPQYQHSRATGVDDNGDVVGYAANVQTNREEPIMWVRTKPVTLVPKVAVTGQPSLAKDPSTLKFNLYVTTSQTMYEGPGTLEFEVLDQYNNRLFPVEARPVPSGFSTNNPSTGKAWSFDLDDLHVPRFSEPMTLTIRVTAVQSVRRSPAASRAMPVKLPVVVARGIYLSGQWSDKTFSDGMQALGYAPEGAGYPTLFFAEYDPNNRLLTDNATSFEASVAYVLRAASPITYARRVDIVTHSKGGLIVRQWLKDYSPEASRVRRLLLCCVPNTGAAIASEAPKMFYGAAFELLPTSGWWRRTAGQDFIEHPANATLKLLNLTPMPPSLDYWVLVGDGRKAMANMTIDEADGHGLTNGDSIVPTFSQLGYEVVNSANGRIERGPIIRAFDPLFGGRSPNAYVVLPYAHSGFLGSAVDSIYSLLATN